MMTDDRSEKPCCAPARDEPGQAQDPASKPATSAQETSNTAVLIPGGKAIVGTNRPVLPTDGEGPARTCTIKPFRMDAQTVTNARFSTFVEQTGFVTEAERLGDSFVFAGFLATSPSDAPSPPGTPWWKMVKGANWRAIYGPGSESALRPDHPVVHVSWNDAKAFAAWAGGRLPTEAEWEHAARGGQGDVRFPWGDAEPNDTDYFPCNIWQGRFPAQDLARDGYKGTAPATSFEPNGFGLFNMVGNVWEWTSQSFTVRSLKKSTIRAHAEKKGFKLIKGGSFLCHASYCYRYRISARSGASPDSSMSHQGFRLVYCLEH